MAKSKKTPTRQEIILRSIRQGNYRKTAALAAGISVDTFYEWLKDPDFLRSVEKAEHEAEQALLATIKRAAPKTWTAAAWILERTRHERFGRKDKVQSEVKGELTLQAMTDEQIEARRQEIAAKILAELPPGPVQKDEEKKLS